MHHPPRVFRDVVLQVRHYSNRLHEGEDSRPVTDLTRPCESLVLSEVMTGMVMSELSMPGGLQIRQGPEMDEAPQNISNSFGFGKNQVTSSLALARPWPTAKASFVSILLTFRATPPFWAPRLGFEASGGGVRSNPSGGFVPSGGSGSKLGSQTLVGGLPSYRSPVIVTKKSDLRRYWEQCHYLFWRPL